MELFAADGHDAGGCERVTGKSGMRPFYGVQAVIAWFRAGTRPNDPKGEGPNKTLIDVVKEYDGGLPNVWTFLVLAIICPLFLNAMGNMLPLRSDNVTYDRTAAALYYLCLAAIGVIITLELSYVYNLRRSAKDWIAMLVVAIALDIITLLVFFNFLGNPTTWGNESLDTWTRTMMVCTTLLALVSSFLILIFARAAGALADGQVHFETSSPAQANDDATVSESESGRRSDGAEKVDRRSRRRGWLTGG